MLAFLHSENIWNELKTLSRERNRRLSVAVPYISRDGGKLLRLKRGDVLVVDLTLENSRNGSVCPAELAQLQKKGVRVFLAPNLHAKIILCGQKAGRRSRPVSQNEKEEIAPRSLCYLHLFGVCSQTKGKLMARVQAVLHLNRPESSSLRQSS